jgi:hypothetical protein
MNRIDISEMVRSCAWMWNRTMAIHPGNIIVTDFDKHHPQTWRISFVGEDRYRAAQSALNDEQFKAINDAILAGKLDPLGPMQQHDKYEVVGYSYSPNIGGEWTWKPLLHWETWTESVNSMPSVQVVVKAFNAINSD